MNKLPAEVFNNIIVLLPLKDKVELMTVCKKWAHTIKTCCLLETIRIASYQQLLRIVEKLQSEHLEAKQVERLIIDLEIDPRLDLFIFINQFPNLRIIFMKGSESTQFQAMTIPSQNNRIESVYDVFGYAIAYYFLTSNKCSRLKRLNISAADNPSIPESILDLFPRLPMLDTLIINAIDLTITELEKLHTLLPSLRSFQLEEVRITDTELPFLIEPALSVTAIEVDMWEGALSMRAIFFRYASRKYPKIKDLVVSTFFFDETSDEVNQFYDECMIPFIKSIEPQLKRYELEMNIMPERFLNQLNRINIRYAHIHLNYQDINPGLEIYIQLNQAKNISELSLESDSDFNLTLLKEFSALKKITVFFDNADPVMIILNDLLKMCCNTVECIDLSNVRLKYDPMDTQIYSNIKKLVFFDIHFDKGIDSFISHYLPNIKYLCFKNCGLLENKFNLSKINLSSLIVKEPYYLENNRFVKMEMVSLLVCTINDNQRTMWISDSFIDRHDKYKCFEFSDHSAYPQVKSVPYDNTRIYQALTFNLVSVKNVIIR